MVSITNDFGGNIGADVAEKLLTRNHLQLKNRITAIETKLSWTVIGRANSENTSLLITSMLTTSACITDLWTLDSLGITDPSEKKTAETIIRPLGRVTEIIPEKEGITRLVRLKTACGEMLIPIQQLFPLEITYVAEDVRAKVQQEQVTHEVSQTRVLDPEGLISQTIKTRSQATMADSGNGELLALLAEMKKSMEAGQERLEKEMRSVQERLEKEMSSIQERLEKEMRSIQERLEKEIRSGQEKMDEMK
ncbi:hypothetical protein HNY73_021598 [Argiope bruennichi]|uniref:Uncharacterized protein n=1 Tax=Argiope bruennichi TaxID=94029 RepID=A0A8T0E1R5_ARGBR|nr:hypothetical protein HNY73_021598 [Argiope bruennichi]